MWWEAAESFGQMCAGVDVEQVVSVVAAVVVDLVGDLCDADDLVELGVIERVVEGVDDVNFVMFGRDGTSVEEALLVECEVGTALVAWCCEVCLKPQVELGGKSAFGSGRGI